jgi:hypothetical protein
LVSILIFPSARIAVSQVIQQTYVGYVSYNPAVQKPWEPIQVGAVTIKIADVPNEIVVSGTDKGGRPWKVYLRTAGGVGYSTAWTADLGGEGGKDLVFVHSYPRNGHCASYSPALTFILFDSNGVPSPAYFRGEYRQDYSFDPEGGKGLLDVGDWNGNGEAELVQVRCYYYGFSEPLEETVYGLADVYEARGAVWTKLGKEERAPHETIYVAVASDDNRDLLPDSKIANIFIPDYSNDHGSQPSNRIVTFTGLEFELDDGRDLFQRA